jgi:ribosome maturation factor RimP
VITGISVTFALAMIDRRERNRSLLLLKPQPKPADRFKGEIRTVMNNENQVSAIAGKLNELLIEYQGYFLVDVSIKPTNNIKVFIDADQGAAIDQLSKINRAIYKWVEETMFPNGDFSIEVSSPGLDEPLKMDRQYLKNVGRFVDVLLKSGIRREGKLISTSENEIVVEEEKGHGKKKELIQHKILKEEIKTTKIQVKF